MTQVTLPPRPRLFDTDDSALENEVQRKGGLAVIAFKNPGSPRALEAGGQRRPISAAQARAGLALVQAAGADMLQVYGLSAMVLVRLPRGTASTLRHSPSIDFVEPMPDSALRGTAIRLSAVPVRGGSTTSRSNVALAQSVPWGISMVHAPGAWSTTRGTSTKVMIMTSGLSSNHPDLPSIPGGNCGGLFNSCSSQFANGTIFAGIIAALDNGIGVVGAAPGLLGSNLYSWRYISDANSNAIDWNQYLSGLNNAPQNGIKVILTDVLYRDYWAAEATAIATAWSAGTIVVASVGDEGRNFTQIYPASYANVVGVAGVRDNGTFAASPTTGCTVVPGSDYGPMVDLAAPYWAYSTGSTTNLQPVYTDTRADLGWCSNALAAAHVAGVIALMRDHYPTWTPDQIVQKLFSTASGGGSRDDYFGYGVPNAQAAVADAPPPPPPITVYISGPNPVQPYSSCQFQAVPNNGTEPITYAWTQDYTPMGDGGGTGWFAANAGGDGTSYLLEVSVTDANGRQASSSLTVTVSAAAGSCNIQ